MKREVKIGLFALLMLLCLYWGINFLKGKDIFNRSHTYYALYEQVNGIQLSAPVIVRGVKVGVVSDIIYNPARSQEVVLELNVRSKYLLPDNSTAKIFTNGFVGGKAIEITLGDAAETLHDGDTIATTVDKDFLSMAGSELEFFKQKFGSAIDRLTVTLDGVNELLEENSAEFHTVMSHLASISGSLDRAIDPEALRGTIDGLRTLSETLGANAGRIDTIVCNIGRLSDSLASAPTSSLIARLDETSARLETILDQIAKGEGSLGRLVNDTALYDSLTVATNNLSLLLEDLRTHPGRYVHFSLFGGGRDKDNDKKERKR